MLTKGQVSHLKKQIRKKDTSHIPLIFAALSDPGRFRIFQLLVKHCGVCVSDVAGILGTSLPAASQQLKILEMSGIVSKERSGKMRCYELRTEDPIIKSIIRIINK
jgi:ArsR family transcriptional regulator, lead/cadmium/zinc/bismuth-responsive transcriptional repressor